MTQDENNENFSDIACRMYQRRGYSFSNDAFDVLVYSICGYRFVNDILFETADKFFYALSQAPESLHYILPCEMSELRYILYNGCTVHTTDYLPLFSKKFADVYLNEFPIFLMFNVRNLPDCCFDFGSALLYDQTTDLSDGLCHVIINSCGKRDIGNKAQQAIIDSGSQVGFSIENQIPGLGNKHRFVSTAESNQNRKDYKMSWYDKIRLADASSASPPGPTNDYHPYEGTPLSKHYEDISTLKRHSPQSFSKSKKNKDKNHSSVERDESNDVTYKNDVVKVPFSEGDKVRRRKGGLGSNQQSVGKVKEITDNHMVIKWDDGEKENVSLNDTTYISQQLDKV